MSEFLSWPEKLLRIVLSEKFRNRKSRFLSSMQNSWHTPLIWINQSGNKIVKYCIEITTKILPWFSQIWSCAFHSRAALSVKNTHAWGTPIKTSNWHQTSVPWKQTHHQKQRWQCWNLQGPFNNGWNIQPKQTLLILAKCLPSQRIIYFLSEQPVKLFPRDGFLAQRRRLCTLFSPEVKMQLLDL